MGEIDVDLRDADLSGRDRRLLDDLVGPAGLALSTVRLTVELRRRAAELEQVTAALAVSTERIADARRVQIERMRGDIRQRVLPHLDRAQRRIADQSVGVIERRID